MSILFFTALLLHANFQVSYLDEKGNHNTLSDVLGKNFTATSNKKTLGMRKDVWLKVHVKNVNDFSQDNYLYLSNVHLMEEVKFYTVINKEVIKQSDVFNRYTDTSSSIGNSLIYKNNIAKQSQIDVYIKIKAKSHILFEIDSGEFTDIVSKIAIDSYFLVLIIGALLALSIYYLLIYLFTPHKPYLYYVLFIISLIIFSFHLYGGYAKYFAIFNTASFANTFIPLSAIFTMLFFKSLFESSLKIYPKLAIVLNAILAFVSVYLIVYILSRLEILPYFSLGFYGSVVYIIQLFGIMGVAIALYFKRIPYMGLFILGYSANFIGAFTSLAFFAGLVPYTSLTFHANILGGMLEAILFSMLLTYKIREVYEEKQKAIEIYKQQNEKIKNMDEVLSFIAHQWRQPLSAVNSSVMSIDDTLYKKKIEVKEIEDELSFIEKSTKYMSESIDDFKDLFSDSKTVELYSINDAVEHSLNVLQKSLENNNINVVFEEKEELYIRGTMNELSQVLLVIFNNAKDVFLEQQISSPTINIKLYSHDEQSYIEVADNGKGIPLEIIDKIFSMSFTLKNKSQGSGLGLYLAKTLVEGRMRGSISVKNKVQGACFTIKLPKELF